MEKQIQKKKIEYKTIAQIQIPLTEFDDRYPDYGSYLWINLIGQFEGSKKIPKRTMVRANIKMKDGTIMKGPLRKNDFENLCKISKLFYSSTNQSKTRLKTLMPKLVKFKTSGQNSKGKKGGER